MAPRQDNSENEDEITTTKFNTQRPMSNFANCSEKDWGTVGNCCDFANTGLVLQNDNKYEMQPKTKSTVCCEDLQTDIKHNIAQSFKCTVLTLFYTGDKNAPLRVFRNKFFH